MNTLFQPLHFPAMGGVLRGSPCARSLPPVQAGRARGPKSTLPPREQQAPILLSVSFQEAGGGMLQSSVTESRGQFFCARKKYDAIAKWVLPAMLVQDCC